MEVRNEHLTHLTDVDGNLMTDDHLTIPQLNIEALKIAQSENIKLSSVYNTVLFNRQRIQNMRMR